MAYVVYGDYSVEYKFTKPESQEWDTTTEHGTFQTVDNNVAFGIWLKRHDSSKPLGTDNYDKYIIYAKQIKGTEKLTAVSWINTRDRIKKGQIINTEQKTYTIQIPEKLGYGMQTLVINYEQFFDETKLYNYFNVTTGIPIFTSEQSVLHYLDTGDTSDSLKFLNADWKLYIDGKSNPLYKLTWECKGLKEIDTTYTDISIWVGTYNVLDDTFNDDDGTKFRNVAYDKHSVKFSYSDIEKLVPQPLVGHNPPSIRVQLAYREFITARVQTSTSMGCELYFSSHPQDSLYNELGYLKLENGTWHRTQEGDGSSFTVKDGQEGSDGYTDDNDNGYNDGEDKDDKDDDTGDVSAGIGVLTSTFKMTKERLIQLGQFLWGSNIFDKFSLVNNNPIENIISCKSIPINADGTNQEIILGNVETGVNGEKISNNFAKQTIGSILINEHYHNFLDYTPYTNVILYLPYIGFKELDTTLVMNKTIQVIYTVDAITGGCLAQVYVNNVRLYEFTGNVGIDIPITASNRAQVEAGYIQAGVGATMSTVGGNVGSAVTSLLNSATSQYHYSSTGNPSPMCVASTNRTCYVIIDRPNYQNLKAFNHTRGRKCYLSKTISTLHGFTICDSNIDLSGINATQSELEELKEILSSGFYV